MDQQIDVDVNVQREEPAAPSASTAEAERRLRELEQQLAALRSRPDPRSEEYRRDLEDCRAELEACRAALAKARRDKEYVQVEVESKEVQAYQQAHEEYARRFPGGAGAVNVIEEFKNQYLSGLKHVKKG